MESDDGIQVHGRVEAMNGFGGYTNISYICTVQRTGKKYLLTDVIVLDAP